MKIRNYKQLLEELSKNNQITLTISLWTYHSKRMIFRVNFEEVKRFLDNDMIFRYQDYTLKFTTGGEEKSFHRQKLKIAKVDCVEIKQIRGLQI